MFKRAISDKDKQFKALSPQQQYAILAKKVVKLWIVEAILLPILVLSIILSVYHVPDKYFIYAMIGVFFIMITFCYKASDIILVNKRLKLMKVNGAKEQADADELDEDEYEIS